MVKKHDDSWQMCVDFTNLNKACLHDCYPLPKIKWKFESLCGYHFKCFLDAYKDYHQIQLAEPDEEKTAFHTRQGVYCYIKMPFGLKNADATYQRLMDKAFESQIGQNIEVYVDNLVVKSYTEAKMLRDIGETFRTLRKINMKLNLKKVHLGLQKECSWAKRLRRYFQAHPITVITDQPIKQIMSRPDVVGLLQKWSIMLGELNITYRPRTSIKGQILADFLIEMPNENPQAAPVAETQQKLWILFTDDSSCLDGSAQMGLKNVHVSVDSKLVANQVLGTYVAKEDNMVKYLDKVRSLVKGFTNFLISQVPRSKNKKADALSKIASTNFAYLSKQVLVEVLKDKSIKEKEVTTMVEEDGPTWMTPIVEYLKEGTLPSDMKEARKLCIKARRYKLIEGILYRRSFLTSWLRCVGPFQAELLHEMDRSKGSGNNHGQSAVIPIEIGMPMYRTARVNVVTNDEELRLNLDLLEEQRGHAAICKAKANSKMMNYYSSGREARTKVGS
nr:reverse transcriptase domain-containing protein [Tanacetum cinerariifolium]